MAVVEDFGAAVASAAIGWSGCGFGAAVGRHRLAGVNVGPLVGVPPGVCLLRS
jgi:hypothetical protein